jgi:cell division protein FtsW
LRTRGRRAAEGALELPGWAEQPARRRGAAGRQAEAAPGYAARRVLVIATVLLLLYGLVMAYSASSAKAYFNYGSSYYFLVRQLVYAGLGLAAMFVIARVDYAWWRRGAVPLAVIVLVGLAAVLVPGVGTSILGARRWIIVGGQSFTPSEPAKLAAVMVIAMLVARRPEEPLSTRGFVRLAAVGIVPASALIMLEPDMGTAIVLVVAVLAVLVVAGARFRSLVLLALIGAGLIALLIIIEPYRRARLTAFLHPWSDPQGTGFQTTQSLISIASGHWFGVGLGNTVQKFGFLPEQTTDMITGIIGEELGLVGLLSLVGLYVFMGWSSFRIALGCRDLFGKLLAVGITCTIVGQACINIGAAMGLLPLTGVPLPLVSLGGTSLLVTLTGVGILMNIATNRRSYIVASARGSGRAGGRGRDRRSSDAGARSRRRAAR